MSSSCCPVCGKTFITSNSLKKYCSVECREKHKKIERQRPREKHEKRKSNGEIIDAYSREANQRHISYGTLQAERYIRKIREGCL